MPSEPHSSIKSALKHAELRAVPPICLLSDPTKRAASIDQPQDRVIHDHD